MSEQAASSSTSSLTSFPDCMTRIYNDETHEESYDAPIPMNLLRDSGRTFVWWLTKIVGVDTIGVAGLACQLYERFLHTQLKLLVNLPTNSPEHIYKTQLLTNQTPLLVGVCIQLTTKICAVETRISSELLQTNLQRINKIYSLTDIKNTEREVLQALEFHIPLWTNVEKAMLLAKELKISGPHLECVGLIVDLTEYYRVSLEEYVSSANFERSSPPFPPVATEPGPSTARIGPVTRFALRNIHLCAAAVAASTKHTQWPGLDPITRLASIARVSIIYLECIRDFILFRFVINEPALRARCAHLLTPRTRCTADKKRRTHRH